MHPRKSVQDRCTDVVANYALRPPRARAYRRMESVKFVPRPRIHVCILLAFQENLTANMI
jgi:hypothetical protein